MVIENLNQYKSRVRDYMFVEKIPLQLKIDFLISYIGGAESDEECIKLFKMISSWSTGAIDSICNGKWMIGEFYECLENMGFYDKLNS